ncbi:MAG: zinc-binding dehydrogenase [Candidatus Rokubacteria bacterium]|nr:zinc-binding dehydrogenase [Candidatus Rokubacteria bacterium]
MMEFKAAILVEQNAPLVVARLRAPALGPGQVLVRVGYSGICGKQIDEIVGKRPDPFLPHLLGHEGGGVVVETGPGVRKVEAGDHVVLHWVKGSGIDSAAPRYEWNGRSVSAGWVTTFSEHTIASENRMTVIPPDIDFDVAALLGCAVTTGLGIVFNNMELRPGQTVAVFGAGGVGLNVIQGAALVNATTIAAIDLHADKLAQAKAFGATHGLEARMPKLAEALRDLTGGRGFDATVDTTGHPEVIQTAYAATADKGRTVLAGVPHHEARITIDSFALHGGRRLLASHGGETVPDVDIPRYLELYRRGRLKLRELITDRYALDDVNEAVARIQRGEGARCVLRMA